MRHVSLITLTSVLLVGCAGSDLARPSTDPPAGPEASAAKAQEPKTKEPSKVSWAGLVDDAIERLIPALGPSAAALGTPLRQVQKSGKLESQLIISVQRQLDALAGSLPPDLGADADALRLTLDALQESAGA